MSQVQQSASSSAGKIVMPSSSTLDQLCKLSIKISKPIDFYFFIDSCRGEVKIVEAEGDRIVYKNNEEHTSPIKHTYKVGNEFLIVTDNTIYVISASTKIAQ